MSQKLKLNPAEVDSLYWQKELSLSDIAQLLDCDMGTVRNTLIHHGHGIRPRGEATRIALKKKPHPIRKGDKSSHWKGGRNKRHGGYIEIYKPEHPRATVRGYVLEHILVWEEAHHQLLPSGWIVHHLNGIKDDNRPKNLLSMPKQGHSPNLTMKEVQKRLREVEAELTQQRLC